MMSNIILKAENISKQYRLGLVGTGTLSHDINRWWHKVRGKEDPYLKVGAVNDRSAKATEDYVWALQDINFEVQQGEVLGIIGKNGAGKSTLLKILSRVTSPTTGVIKTKGRIASLLEVGTGFHPELTGRENIFLNGAILGMTKPEIRSKIDEIIDFSGCEMYIDTPVKRYSSGMRVRLGFAVAAHLEPDILVVDEVLAVGDAEFQKKAIGKMQDVSRGEGRTILFVSHNMAAVQNLCTRGIVLENGTVAYEGDVEDSVYYYLSQNDEKEPLEIRSRKGHGKVKLQMIRIKSNNKEVTPQTGIPLDIEFEFDNSIDFNKNSTRFDCRIDDYIGNRVIWLSTSVFEVYHKRSNKIKFSFDKFPLNNNRFYMTTYLKIDGEISDWVENVFSFDVVEGVYYENGKQVPNSQSLTLFDYKIELL